MIRRRWMVVRYLDGAHPKIMGYYWSGTRAERRAGEMRTRHLAGPFSDLHYQFVIAYRGSR